MKRSINFQRDIKTLSAIEKREKDFRDAMTKAVDVQKFIFFSPTETINKLRDPNQDLSLKKVREFRKSITRLVMNIDNVIYRLYVDNPSNLKKQLELLLHVFDGIERVTREEKNKIKLLRKTPRGVNFPAVSPSLMVESLSKGRIFCMFFIKWLTTTDNDYTDRSRRWLVGLKFNLFSLSRTQTTTN